MKLKDRFKSSRFFQGEKLKAESVTLTHRRIYILPTQRGLGFVILTGLLLLIAFIYNNNLVYMLAFLLFGIFFITILHSFKSLNALTLNINKPQPVFLGKAAEFILTVKNQTVDFRHQLHFSGKNCQTCTENVNSFEQKDILLLSPTQKRGWHFLETLTVSCEFPLGLFRVWSPLHFDVKTLVYPNPLESEIQLAEQLEAGVQQNITKQKMGDDEFFSLKPYQAGDSIKQIHWKSYAKGMGLFNKQYSSESVADIWLDYDKTTAHTIEGRLSQLCFWVIESEKLGANYGFKLLDFILQPNHGKRHFTQCLDALALF